MVFASYPDAAALIGRLVLGALFLAHGWPKIKDVRKPIGFVKGTGWPEDQTPDEGRRVRIRSEDHGSAPSDPSGARTRKTFHIMCRGVRRRLRERPFEELGDVESADVLAVLRLRGVVEHDQAVRARGCDRVGSRLLDVAEAAVVHPLARP